MSQKVGAGKIVKEVTLIKNSMLNWTDEEIHTYFAKYFDMNPNQAIVEVYDRTNSRYQIEASQDNEAMGKGTASSHHWLGMISGT